MKKVILSLTFLLVLFSACNEPTDTPTKGKLTLYTDESVLPLVTKEVGAFTSSYPETSISLIPINATDGIEKLINEDIEMYISSRNFNYNEQTKINEHNIPIKTYDFCYGGIVVIASRENKIKNITLDELKNLMLGKSSQYRIFLPQEKTGLYEFIKNEYLDGQKPTGAELLAGDKEIKTSVWKDPRSIGLTGFNLVKDTTDIRIVPLGILNHDSGKITYYKPHPAYFINGNYPMTREIYIFLNENHFDVATGFTSFLTSTDGQKIVLAENLAPASVPVKLVSPK